MITQLDIPTTPDTLPVQWTARTLIDSRTYLLGDFDPDLFCEADADGNPFLSDHYIYQGDVFVGRIFRYSKDLPWIISPRGEPCDRVVDSVFEEAVQSLVRWRIQLDERDQQLIKEWGLK